MKNIIIILLLFTLNGYGQNLLHLTDKVYIATINTSFGMAIHSGTLLKDKPVREYTPV